MDAPVETNVDNSQVVDRGEIVKVSGNPAGDESETPPTMTETDLPPREPEAAVEEDGDAKMPAASDVKPASKGDTDAPVTSFVDGKSVPTAAPVPSTADEAHSRPQEHRSESFKYTYPTHPASMAASSIANHAASNGAAYLSNGRQTWQHQQHIQVGYPPHHGMEQQQQHLLQHQWRAAPSKNYGGPPPQLKRNITPETSPRMRFGVQQHLAPNQAPPSSSAAITQGMLGSYGGYMNQHDRSHMHQQLQRPSPALYQSQSAINTGSAVSSKYAISSSSENLVDGGGASVNPMVETIAETIERKLNWLLECNDNLMELMSSGQQQQPPNSNLVRFAVDSIMLALKEYEMTIREFYPMAVVVKGSEEDLGYPPYVPNKRRRRDVDDVRSNLRIESQGGNTSGRSNVVHREDPEIATGPVTSVVPKMKKLASAARRVPRENAPINDIMTEDKKPSTTDGPTDQSMADSSTDIGSIKTDSAKHTEKKINEINFENDAQAPNFEEQPTSKANTGDSKEDGIPQNSTDHMEVDRRNDENGDSTSVKQVVVKKEVEETSVTEDKACASDGPIFHEDEKLPWIDENEVNDFDAVINHTRRRSKPGQQAWMEARGRRRVIRVDEAVALRKQFESTAISTGDGSRPHCPRIFYRIKDNSENRYLYRMATLEEIRQNVSAKRATPKNNNKSDASNSLDSSKQSLSQKRKSEVIHLPGSIVRSNSAPQGATLRRIIAGYYELLNDVERTSGARLSGHAQAFRKTLDSFLTVPNVDQPPEALDGVALQTYSHIVDGTRRMWDELNKSLLLDGESNISSHPEVPPIPTHSTSIGSVQGNDNGQECAQNSQRDWRSDNNGATKGGNDDETDLLKLAAESLSQLGASPSVKG